MSIEPGKTWSGTWLSSEGTGYRRGSARWRAGMSVPLELQQCRGLLLQSVLKVLSVPQDPSKCGTAKGTG